MTLINFITQIFFLLIYLPVLLNFVDSHSSSSVNLLCMLPQISMLLSQWFYECSFSFSFSNNSTEACLISSWLFMSSRSLLFSIAIYLIYQAAVFSLQNLIWVYISMVSDLILASLSICWWRFIDLRHKFWQTLIFSFFTLLFKFFIFFLNFFTLINL